MIDPTPFPFYVTRITLKNFLQFRDATINLHPSSGRNIAVIEGPNGSGKTNIIKAINWCLFGGKAYSSKPSAPHCMCNYSVFKSLQSGEFAEVAVAIHLNTQEGPVEISRSIKVTRDTVGNSRQQGQSTYLSVFRITKGGRQEISKPEAEIAKIFPSRTRRLSILDGCGLQSMIPTLGEREVEQAALECPAIISSHMRELLMRKGFCIANYFSASEQLCLKYAILAVKRKRAHILTPLIIDSPFSKLSANCHKGIAALFEKQFQLSQVLLFVLPGECSWDISSGLRPRISDRLKIKPGNKTCISEVTI